MRRTWIVADTLSRPTAAMTTWVLLTISYAAYSISSKVRSTRGIVGEWQLQLCKHTARFNTTSYMLIKAY